MNGNPVGHLSVPTTGFASIEPELVGREGANEVSFELSVAGTSLECARRYLGEHGWRGLLDFAGLKEFERKNNHRPIEISELQLIPIISGG
jgi:hypothetical protein